MYEKYTSGTAGEGSSCMETGMCSKKIFSCSEILISSGILRCDDEGLDWNDDSQENQGETNDGAQANECTGMNNPENMDETGSCGKLCFFPASQKHFN